jgi:uncharacterized protein with ACT and thioredoxin-like domain
MEKYHKKINDAEAEEYLNSLGRLFLVFAKIEGRKAKERLKNKLKPLEILKYTCENS